MNGLDERSLLTAHVIESVYGFGDDPSPIAVARLPAFQAVFQLLRHVLYLLDSEDVNLEVGHDLSKIVVRSRSNGVAEHIVQLVQ